MLCHPYRARSHVQDLPDLLRRQPHRDTKGEQLALGRGQLVEQRDELLRVLPPQGRVLRGRRLVDLVGYLVDRHRGAVRRAHGVGDPARGDGVDERLEGSARVAVAGQRVEDGQADLLRSVLGGMVSTRQGAQPCAAVSVHHQPDPVEQVLDRCRLPGAGADGHLVQGAGARRGRRRGCAARDRVPVRIAPCHVGSLR